MNVLNISAMRTWIYIYDEDSIVVDPIPLTVLSFCSDLFCHSLLWFCKDATKTFDNLRKLTIYIFLPLAVVLANSESLCAYPTCAITSGKLWNIEIMILLENWQKYQVFEWIWSVFNVPNIMCLGLKSYLENCFWKSFLSVANDRWKCGN